jgi:hypothetical protein
MVLARIAMQTQAYPSALVENAVSSYFGLPPSPKPSEKPTDIDTAQLKIFENMQK